MLAKGLNLFDALVSFKLFTDKYLCVTNCTVQPSTNVPYRRCSHLTSLDTRALGLILPSEDRSARSDPCNRVDISYAVIPASIDTRNSAQ